MYEIEFMGDVYTVNWVLYPERGLFKRTWSRDWSQYWRADLVFPHAYKIWCEYIEGGRVRVGDGDGGKGGIVPG